MQICSPEVYLSGEPLLDNLQESWKNAIFRHLGRGNGRGQGRNFVKIVQRCSVGPYLSIEPSFNMFQNFFVVIQFCLGNTFGLTLDLKENVKKNFCISGHPPMMFDHVAKGIRFLSLLIFQKKCKQTHRLRQTHILKL